MDRPIDGGPGTAPALPDREPSDPKPDAAEGSLPPATSSFPGGRAVDGSGHDGHHDPGTGRLINVIAAPRERFAADAEGQGYRSTQRTDALVASAACAATRPFGFDSVSPDYDFDETAYAIIVGEWRLYRTNHDQSWHEISSKPTSRNRCGGVLAASPHRRNDLRGHDRGLFKWSTRRRDGRWCRALTAAPIRRGGRPDLQPGVRHPLRVRRRPRSALGPGRDDSVCIQRRRGLPLGRRRRDMAEA